MPAPAGRTGCDPEFPAPPSATLFYLRNKNRPTANFIRDEITALGHFHYDVRNDPDDGRGCPGGWLFEQAWDHFARQAVAVRGIRGGLDIRH